jgi:hypothetical protein
MIRLVIINLLRYIFLGIFWIFAFTFPLVFIYCIRFTVYVYNTYFNSYEGWAKAGVIILHILSCLIGYLIIIGSTSLMGEFSESLKKYLKK